ncbi:MULTISPECIES: TetR/AcrR family transcriptional regulator [Ruminococcus]|uniref:Transcriptional regulator, TetR family n=1 Tax=Ruminococcus albus (strain ATCC 27210 / DSM 20455 / JCM 14654 / NCDO 2250 / 7) TaxID=697329 RepID=E6UCI4_RUMA7|nr:MULTISPECIES: TetR/AcrR family transcriptional regulator [Ruminococcus]ADU21589.1 transcriptional regulator, TetR family [Ruminococcus albus 7 = DSM 20455]MCR5020643.1 TetR/AcrR family transcriptional regulator [Ruminococcus sp.]
MGKLDINKKAKEDSLLATAYKLFTTNGVSKTSVSDIAKSAGVAKGTFYLYFKDKYDLKNRLVAHQSSKLFSNAISALEAESKEMSFNEKIIFVIDNILDQLEGNHAMVAFIAKNLSWGVFKHAVTSPSKGDNMDLRAIYDAILADAPDSITEPEIMLFMIVELVSSTCHSAILYGEPVSLEKLKPYVYRSVNDIINRHISADN